MILTEYDIAHFLQLTGGNVFMSISKALLASCYIMRPFK